MTLRDGEHALDVAGTGVAEHEVDFGELRQHGLVVARHGEAVARLGLDSGPPGVKEDR
jgi:hypothetical protein